MTNTNQRPPLNYSLLTWVKHIKNEAGLNMFESAESSPNLGH